MGASGGQRVDVVRVLIADDSAPLVETLLAALEPHPALEVVATAADGDAVVAAVVEMRPDVVLMDLRLGGDWGLDLLPAIAASDPAPAVVVYSAACDEATRRAVREAGVVVQLDKGAPLQEVLDALIAAAAGRPDRQS